MLHKPAVVEEKDYAIGYKMRVGIIMFVLYALIYAGFVIINVSNPIKMESIVFSGLNLAVVYGFGLIVFALILALFYNSLCTKKEAMLNKKTENKEGR